MRMARLIRFVSILVVFAAVSGVFTNFGLSYDVATVHAEGHGDDGGGAQRGGAPS